MPKPRLPSPERMTDTSSISGMMSAAIMLRRSGSSRRMHRFYRLSVESTLFGGWSCQREWARIGSPGRVRRTSYSTQDEARERLHELVQAKRRHGYAEATGRMGHEAR